MGLTRIGYIILGLLTTAQVTGASDWSYTGKYGPKNWSKLDSGKACSGNKQSPIDIISNKAVHDWDLPKISIDEVTKTENKDLLENNGHTVTCTVRSGDFRVQGLHRNYKVAQFHFHWGKNDKTGSEHLLDGQAFPLEMHIVTYDAGRFQSISEAINETEGLAVLGVMFQIRDLENKNLQPLVNAFPNILNPDDNNQVEVSVDWRQLLPLNTSRYYRYAGSLTTPGCFESVVWTVFKETQEISSSQLSMFRELLQTEKHGKQKPILFNYRPVQPLNHRIVWSTEEIPEVNKTTNDTKSATHSWSYSGKTGPEYWAKLSPIQCAGKQQSPINIVTKTTQYNQDLRDFIIFDSPYKKSTIKNNGHTVQVDFADNGYKVMEGNLKNPYTVAQFHFHWGSFDGQGSEHLIDGNPFPLEMHIVTYDSDRFNSLHEAVTEDEGLAVLGIMFQISDKDNEALNPVIDSLDRVKIPDDTAVMLKEPLSLLPFLPTNTSLYYRYNGSLTTPGCYESVIWTIFAEFKHISVGQMEKFRNLYAKHPTNSTKNKKRKDHDKDQPNDLNAEIDDVEYDKVGAVTDINDLNSEINNLNLDTKIDRRNAKKKHMKKSTKKHMKRSDRKKKAKSVKDTADVFIVDNFRPVQPLNGRIVERSFKGEKKVHWSYSGDTGPENWSDLFPDKKCDGMRQSPINIVRKEAEFNKNLTRFNVHYKTEAADAKMSLVNNGHTVKFTFRGQHFVSGGGLENEYKFVQGHFHWGSINSQGSEHTINDDAYPIELHLVTYNAEKYASFGEAVTQPDGLAVLGVLFKITHEKNPILSDLVDMLDKVSNADTGNFAEIPPMSPRYLLPVDLSRYYRYLGSLTTPGCYESVIWTVFTERLPISQKQLDAFRRLKTFSKQNDDKNHNKMILDSNAKAGGSHKNNDKTKKPDVTTNTNSISDNFRPTQKLYNRTVYKSFDDNCYKIYKVGKKLRCVEQVHTRNRTRHLQVKDNASSLQVMTLTIGIASFFVTLMINWNLI